MKALGVLLGFVHGLVRALEQGRAIDILKRTLGDSNGNPQRNRLMIDQHWLSNDIDHLFRHQFGVCKVLSHRKQTPELIAAQPCYCIRFAYNGGQSVSNLAKSSVTTMVTQAVINLLEKVQVHHHYGERFAIALALKDQLIEAV